MFPDKGFLWKNVPMSPDCKENISEIAMLGKNFQQITKTIQDS
jgi:hypothetical protein